MPVRQTVSVLRCHSVQYRDVLTGALNAAAASLQISDLALTLYVQPTL